MIRRYVRVRRVQRGLGPDGHGIYRTRPWWHWECICGVWGGKYDLADSHANASKHAGRCVTIRLAVERDHYAARLDQRDAFAARAEQERDQLRAERDQWRTKAHDLAAELLLRDERKETPC